MIKKKKEKIIITICIVTVLVSVLLFENSNSSIIGAIEEGKPDLKIKLQYWTDGIIVSDANISALSSSGSGTIDDPYILDNLYINTTDGIALEFEGVSLSTYWVLRDSTIIGRGTYGVYISDNISGKGSIINCTIEGDLTIGTPNAHYLTVHNCTLRSSQGNTYRRGLTFTENVVYTTGSYSGHLMRVRNEDNIIKDNVYYGNTSQIIFQNIRNSTIENNVLHSTGFDIYKGPITEISNNTFENNIVNGKPFGFFYNRSGDTITGNQYGQIYIVNSINTIIESQTMEDNYVGIQVQNCSDITIDNVIVSGKNGIEIDDTNGLLIQNCELEGFRTGIEFYTATDVTIQNNHISKYQRGMDCNFVDEIQINNNTIVETEDSGIYFEDNWNIEIMFNIISCDVQVSGSENALILWVCENISIYYNVFISLGNLTAPPVEEGSCTNIQWYEDTLDVGNYYSDWNGIGTYAIPGNVGSVDFYPFIDIDEDTLNEFDEVVIHLTDPFSPDSDLDGLDDGEEVNTYNTDPLSDDSDSDGMDDLWEVTNGTDPIIDDADNDPDEDGLTNIEEYNLNTLPTNNDTDSDGMDDYWEATYGTDPLTDDAEDDPDEDGLTNLTEYGLGTLPMNNDTDGDSYTDGEEVVAGTDPLDSSSFPVDKSFVGLIIGLVSGSVVVAGVVGFLFTSKGKSFLKGLLDKIKK